MFSFYSNQKTSVRQTRVAVLKGYLGAGFGAVHDGVAAVQRERILQLGQTFLCELIS